MALLYDAHIHLTDDEYSSYISHIITNLRAMKIVACSVTVDLFTTEKSFALFEQARDVVKQFVGIHPEAAARENLDKFKEVFYANLHLIDGVGEVGLDGTYDVPYDRQKHVFSTMLELAEAEEKPVSIHSRKALDDVLEVLPSYKLNSVLLHWFAGSKKQLARSMDMGLYVSYGPTLVYSEDKKVLLKNSHKDKFLVETDGPVRYSKCFENFPAVSTSSLVSVVWSAARTLGISYEEAAQVLEKNSRSYLGGKF
ncbi:MAG TPA: TatD family hydrolase [Nitrososphaera sp.]|nr:TatD family hydrolase [Nitrososphaera sp.]